MIYYYLCYHIEQILCTTVLTMVFKKIKNLENLESWRNDTLNLHNQYTINWYTGKHTVCIFFKHICCITMHFNKWQTKCIFFFNLFIFYQKIRIRYKYPQQTYDMHIQFYGDKKHLIYKNKHVATLHWNFKHQGQFQMATTFYIYILFV